MFCIDVSFFISIVSFFISFISFDNTQKTIYRTATKKNNVISFSFTRRFRRAVVIITGPVCATFVCQVDNEGVFMFVDPREPKDCSLLSNMSQRYNSNVDFSQTQIIIWAER